MSKHIHNVVHLTSVHKRYDTRIFLKMCTSLAKNNYNVTLIVADGLGDEINCGVRIIDVGANKKGRFSRMTKTVNSIFVKAKTLSADIYHLHDPELIPIGLKLKKIRKKVIFDAHEDLPKQILSKPYLNPLLLRLVSYFFSSYEKYTCVKFNGIIAATPTIKKKFLTINTNTLDINNYPIIGELFTGLSWEAKKNEIVYVGGISDIRGIRQLVNSCEYLTTNARLNLVGNFSNLELHQQIKKQNGWGRVNELGFLKRDAVREVMSRSVAGLVTFLYAPNHINSQPNKLFEYMSSGLPIISSNFDLWKEIIDRYQCGICVDPSNPKEISAAIDYLVLNPNKAQEMGNNGRKAVLEHYNWDREELKLLKFYEAVIKD